MLSGSTLLVLAVLWGVVLVPRAVRDLRSSPVSTVTGFSDAMARLAMCDQRLVVVPAGSGRRVVVHPRAVPHTLLVRRRRAILARLAVGTVGTVAVAVVLGGPVAWAFAGISTAVLLGYCAALRVLARRRTAPRQRPRGEVAAQGPAPAARTARAPRATAVDDLGPRSSAPAVAVAATATAPEDVPWPAAVGDPFGPVHDWAVEHAPAPALVAEVR